MRPLALLIVLAVVPTIATGKTGTELAAGRQVLTHHLDRMTFREALTLNGQRGNFLVELDSLPGINSSGTVFFTLG
jgi:hypothetical protein